MAQYWQGLLYQPDCILCPLRGSKLVLPDGPIPARICFVGEGPGANEVIDGRGFVGKSGYILWKLANAMGIDRKDVWVSNSALCRPRDVTLASGFTIKEKQVKELSVKACRKRLLYELLYVTGGDPTAVIVPIGNLALRSLALSTGRKNMGIFNYRGSLLEVDLYKAWEEAQTQQAGW